MVALLAGLLLVLTACSGDLASSGRYPDVRVLSDVLTPTAGPPVRVDEAWSRTAYFAVRNPPGWTVETAAAPRGPAVLFRQGPCTTLTVAPYPHPARIPEACEDVPLRLVLRGLPIEGRTILVLAMAPLDDWPAVAPAVASVSGGITRP